MHRSSLFLTVALVGTTVALIQTVAVAKSASEIERIAKAVTVEIKLKQSGRVGSGVIINRKGDLYTLVTNRHVICGASNCPDISVSEVFSLGLFDGQKYQVQKSAIKLLGSNLDLAIIQFRSNLNYSVAKVAALGSLKVTNEVYTAGFPSEQPGFTFGVGKAISVVNKRLIGDGGGYTVIYDALTLPGMSGGGVFDGNGQLIAIHGQGDRYQENTNMGNQLMTGRKIGYNRGIPIRWLVQSLAEIGINLGASSSDPRDRAARQQVPINADEYFITGFNKYVDPGEDVKAGKRKSIQEFTKAIQLNSKYEYAYFIRGIAYLQLQEHQQSLADFNRVININPKNFEAYYSRAVLKRYGLNDFQGALADYNQAIMISSIFLPAYIGRAEVKKYLGDFQGALADYNQIISFNPKLGAAYSVRAILKEDNLNDFSGALADYNQAIALDPKDSDSYYRRAFLKRYSLKDFRGALTDYNQAIALKPKDSVLYYIRADLKEKLNDIQGALIDYNQAIALKPKDPAPYSSRAFLKAYKLNDRAGAVQDFRQAARLYRAAGQTQDLQSVIDELKKLGATE
jgi:tetratricopeptide (TPR) repeat protein